MKRLLSSRLLFLALLPLAFGLSACDSGGSNSDEDEINNEFSFEISPTDSSAAAAVESKQDRLEGFSFFVDTRDVEDVNSQEFVIYFNNNDSFSQSDAQSGLFGFVARESTQPDEGEYSFTDGSEGQTPSQDFIGFLYEDIGAISGGGDTQDIPPFYIIQGGQLDITTSTDNRVAGQVRAVAIQFSLTDFSQEYVELSGDFTARNLDNYVDFEQYTDPSGSGI